MVQGFAGKRRYVPESPCRLRRVGLIVLACVAHSAVQQDDFWTLGHREREGMFFGARKVATKRAAFVARVLPMFLLEGYLRMTLCCC